MLWILIIIFIAVFDQLTKFFVQSKIELYEMRPVVDKFFYITHVTNKGAAWSIFQNGRYFFIVLTTIISAVMFYVLFKVDDRLLKYSLSFILGGAIGNLIDRILRGKVTDFLEFHFGNYQFPTFNIADCFIVIGSFLLGYYLLFVYKEPKDKII